MVGVRHPPNEMTGTEDLRQGEIQKLILAGSEKNQRSSRMSFSDVYQGTSEGKNDYQRQRNWKLAIEQRSTRGGGPGNERGLC